MSDSSLAHTAPATTTSSLASPKEALKLLQRLYKDHRTAINAATKELHTAEKDHVRAVKKARAAAQAAATPRKLASLGFIQKVVLTETAVDTPKGRYQLTPDVTARADQHGNKQVVQGWVFKSDNDRREVYLHIESPNWAVVIPYELKQRSIEPRQIHEFATKINMAARNSEQARAGVAERSRQAQIALAAVMTDCAEVEAAAQRLVGTAWSVADLRAVKESVERYLKTCDDARAARKASEIAAALHRDGNAWAHEATAEKKRVEAETTAAEEEAAKLRRPAVQPARADKPADKRRPATPVTQVMTPPAPAQDAQQTDLLDQIRKLAELHEAGILTDEEFSIKKAELLARL